MQLKIRENRKKEFICGLALLSAGLILYLSNVYVATPFFSGAVSIGGLRIYSGVFTLPLIAAAVWLLLAPAGKKKAPVIAVLCAVGLLLGASLFTVAIRVRAIPVVMWVLIIASILTGGILMLRAVETVRTKKTRRRR